MPEVTSPQDGPAEAARQAAALARAVAVMDRLRSPGGCPWYALQTHASLLPYAVEEVHEVVEAVESGDRAGLQEELGDLLLQVLFHARLAAEDEQDPFDVADVADGLVAKLVRRNPHVFGAEDDGQIDVATVLERWEHLKRAEKPARTSALDGVPATLGALARAQKLLARADQAGLLADAPPPDVVDPSPEVIGETLLAVVVAAHRSGVDAEAALRRATAAWESTARAAES